MITSFAALVCLGEARYGIKMNNADLARCEEQSQTAEKFVLNLLEYLVTPADCQEMTVYGHGKTKLEAHISLYRSPDMN